MAAPHTSTPPATPPTPTGVKVLCVLGVLALLVELERSLALMADGAALGLALLALTAAHAAVLWGLWTMRPWAWTGAMVFYGLSIVVSLVRLDAIRLVVGVLVVTYLAFVSEPYRSRSVNPRVD
ncbi:hypothetical protein [Halarchaeum sp. P4]|uniref:hypothetical protein n=1 Tax=Halarchaeum sp. P4 TaxID=3421639 RepID=UPI003EBCF861